MNRQSVAERRKAREKKFPSATSEDVKRAVEQYLSGGGKITRVEPEWIIEGSIYISS